MKGIISYVNQNKKFGFIKNESESIHFSFENIYGECHIGGEVNFFTEKNPKGKTAYGTTTAGVTCGYDYETKKYIDGWYTILQYNDNINLYYDESHNLIYIGLRPKGWPRDARPKNQQIWFNNQLNDTGVVSFKNKKYNIKNNDQVWSCNNYYYININKTADEEAAEKDAAEARAKAYAAEEAAKAEKIKEEMESIFLSSLNQGEEEEETYFTKEMNIQLYGYLNWCSAPYYMDEHGCKIQPEVAEIIENKLHFIFIVKNEKNLLEEAKPFQGIINNIYEGETFSFIKNNIKFNITADPNEADDI